VDAYFAALEALIEADREGDRRIISVGEVGLGELSCVREEARCERKVVAEEIVLLGGTAP
jgi:hypothetical protein